jgi:HAAS
MDARGRFLGAVAERLPLPEDVRGEVLEELAAHLADAVDDLRSQGRTPEDAVVEAISRLGPPANLARELARAHRPRGRVLAATGAGTISAVATGAIGVVLATFCVVVGAMLLMALVRALASWMGVTFSMNWAGGWNTLLTAVALDAGALLAGAAAVRAAALAGWRSVSEVRTPVALVGGAVVGWIVLVVLSQALNWPSVAALLLVPISFALGTRVDRLQLPNLRIVVVAVLVGLLATIGLGLATWQGGGGGGAPQPWNPSAAGDMIAPWWQDPSAGGPVWFSEGSGSYPQAGVIDLQLTGGNAAQVAYFRDYRLEAWRSESPEAGSALVRGQTAPFALAPATPEGVSVAGTLYFDRTPGVEWAQVAVTAVAPDGTRYLLSVSGPGPVEFHGSVWDWFAAMLAPAAA